MYYSDHLGVLKEHLGPMTFMIKYLRAQGYFLLHDVKAGRLDWFGSTEGGFYLHCVRGARAKAGGGG